jgi:hypothetical protein
MVNAFQKQTRGPTAGAFHQHPSGYAECFDGLPIHVLHLVCRNNNHDAIL